MKNNFSLLLITKPAHNPFLMRQHALCIGPTTIGTDEDGHSSRSNACLWILSEQNRHRDHRMNPSAHFPSPSLSSTLCHMRPI
jgi:hypothetical protein